MSAFLYVTRTIKLPVRAVGCALLDSEDRTVATCPDSFTATAMSVLANYGSLLAKQAEDAHDESERKFAEKIFAKPRSPWANGA